MEALRCALLLLVQIHATGITVAAPVDTGGAAIFPVALTDDSPVVAGATQLVQLSDGVIALYRKSDGLLQQRPLHLAQVYSQGPASAGARACAAPLAGSESLLYDALAQRWAVLHAAHDGKSYVCVAQSAGADAAGPWSRAAMPVAGQRGQAARIDTLLAAAGADGLHLTYSLSDAASGERIGSRVCGIDRKSLAARTPRLRCQDPGAHHPQATPARQHSGSGPVLLVALDMDHPLRGERLTLWRYDVRRNRLTGPLSLPVKPYTVACIKDCIAQPPGGVALPAFADRIGPGAVQRGDTLVATHTVANRHGAAALRWYEIRDASGRPAVYQQGTHGDDTVNRWMGAIGIDKMGNIALAYQISSADTPPGMRYTGRMAREAPGRMQEEEFLVDGSGVQTGAAGLRLSASQLVLDPTDDCTFWYTGRHVAASGDMGWRTRVARFTFRGCR